MKVLITGAEGFIGRNLKLRLSELKHVKVVSFTRADSPDTLETLISDVDFVFHLAGVNRPQETREFEEGNVALTRLLSEAVAKESKISNKNIRLIYTSSTQAELDNDYGKTKYQAEIILKEMYGHQAQKLLHIYRLPNLFGKWSKPNYNSVVATFCHNIARDLPVEVHNPDSNINLVYIDDLIDQFICCMEGKSCYRDSQGYTIVTPQYNITLGALKTLLLSFRESRNSLEIDHVGNGLKRALYATYVSYLPTEAFSYALPKYEDLRGVFVEMLKTPDCGQFSFFTAHPGVTRGGHYHNSKSEKFLVIKGKALFRFKHMHTGEVYTLETDGTLPRIVETIPGWAHDITNNSDDELIVMLWANEKFDREHPDTFTFAL